MSLICFVNFAKKLVNKGGEDCYPGRFIKFHIFIKLIIQDSYISKSLLFKCLSIYFQYNGLWMARRGGLLVGKC